MKIGFAKLFKVSGTTVADILLRLSYFYGSFFDLQTDLEVFNNLYPFIHEKLVPFDIVIEDKKWNLTEVEKMVGDESVFVTIIRDPVFQFESMFQFMDMRKFYNVSSFETFLQNLELNTINENRSYGKYGRNQLCFSLGLEQEFFENDTAIELFVQEIDSKFKLVMISDFFDESVILLKNLLGLHLTQMLYAKQLPRKKTTIYKLSEKQEILLRKWLSADVKLYNYFKRKLEDRITKKVREQVIYFQKLNRRLQKFCKVFKINIQGADSPSKRFGILELELIRSNRSNLLCDFYIGDAEDKFVFAGKALKHASEVRRFFQN